MLPVFPRPDEAKNIEELVPLGTVALDRRMVTLSVFEMGT